MSIQICAVTGSVKDLSDTAVDATIRVYSEPFFHTNTLMAVSDSVDTDSNGDFSIDVIETETISEIVNFEISYVSNGVPLIKVYPDIEIPNTSTATLSSLI